MERVSPLKNDIDVTDAEIDAAIERGKSAPDLRKVKSARYDAQADMLELCFPEGTELFIPRRLLEELSGATPEDLTTIDFSGSGTVLWWPRLEVGHAVSDLEAGWYGSPSWCEHMGLHPRAA